MVTFTSFAPWGEQKQVGRVVSAAADGARVRLEWVDVTGPVDADVLEPFDSGL